MISLQCLKCWQLWCISLVHPHSSSPCLSEFIFCLLCLGISHDLSDTLCWWHYSLKKTETIRNDSPQKTWHHINLPVDISVQILSHLLLPIYYCEWTVLYGQGQPIHPCSRSHLLSSLSFQLMAFIFFFLITWASSNNNTKTAFVWGPKV